MNYYDPSDYFTGCHEWTWLQPTCYEDGKGEISARSQLTSDLSFVRRNHLGSFLRVWVSLDQLMLWNRTRGFQGYIPGALQNVDDALRQFAAAGVKVDLVLFVYAPGSGWLNQFHPEALDGQHNAMRANYLRALKLFLRHIASNSTDASTVAMMELQTEPYYQLEQYFSNPSNLGSFRNCIASGDLVRNDCIDQRIVHPWLIDLYRTARAASTRFPYTVADTGRLLTQNQNDQRYWISMYPVDVYDIHLYENSPWTDPARWRTGLKLPKPWFAGEAGCASGNIACTYNGTSSDPIDTWWLRHLQADGAKAVLLESHVTLWTYPNGPRSQTLTRTGEALACVTLREPPSCHGNPGS